MNMLDDSDGSKAFLYLTFNAYTFYYLECINFTTSANIGNNVTLICLLSIHFILLIVKIANCIIELDTL